MNHKDWDPDDFLDFDYGKPVPRENDEPRAAGDPGKESQPSQSRTSGQSSSNDSEELKRYYELRRGGQASEKPASSDAFRPAPPLSEKKAPQVLDDPEPLFAAKSFLSRGDKSDKTRSRAAEALEERKRELKQEKKQERRQEKKPEKVFAKKTDKKLSKNTSKNTSKNSGNRSAVKPEKNQARTPEEAQALKQAQQEAYDRYRSNYSKITRKKNKKGKAGTFPKVLSLVYILALAAFIAAMTIMDVLPLGMMIALYTVIVLLSMIIVTQLRKSNVRNWVRFLASVTAIALIVLYGVGTAYAMGTLSFLDVTSVENDKRVGNVTRDAFNVCITGMDVRGEIDTEGRSDVNMVVTVNPKTHQILMTSIPRDYQIYMPDKDMAMDKLTHTGFYSVETTIGAEENLLGTEINYFVKVNFSTVQKFIDAIGGVDVYSEYSFTPVKLKSWTVQEGMNHMNGKQALAFARERKAFPTGDNQRVKNQQAVFEAIIKKATSSKTMVKDYMTIMDSLKDYFRMSFSSSELRRLIKFQLAKNPDWKIYKNTLVGGDGSLPTYSTGNAYAYVMTQDEESIANAKTLIQAVLNGETLGKDDEGNVIVVSGEESDN